MLCKLFLFKLLLCKLLLCKLKTFNKHILLSYCFFLLFSVNVMYTSTRTHTNEHIFPQNDSKR